MSFADDCALNASIQSEMQEILDLFLWQPAKILALQKLHKED